MRTLIAILLIGWTSWAAAEELRWGFAGADGMPYVNVHKQQLRGGFIYKLGQQASKRLEHEVRFIEPLNKRIDEFMQRGRIHVICNNNPQWMDTPERYHWSPPLFSEEDRLIIHQQHAPINSTHDLYGKTLGTQLGYVYNAELMVALAKQQITRTDLRDSNAGLNLLRTQRLDAIINMHRPLKFQLAKQPSLPLQLNPWVIERYDMHCTYSPQLPVSANNWIRCC